jgi:chorismate mutase
MPSKEKQKIPIVNVDREKKLLAHLKKLQEKEIEANERLLKDTSEENSKLYAA